MAMYDPSLQWQVLRLLERWGRLPLSDVERLLAPLQRPRFRKELVDDMVWDGLIVVRAVGDEDVLEMTPRGRDRLRGSPAPPAARQPESEEGHGGREP